MDPPHPAVATKASGTRVSSACLPCRERHIRCGAEKPQCKRCSVSGRPCHYTKSRRGGLDREALAACRRRKLAEQRPSAGRRQHPTSPSIGAPFAADRDGSGTIQSFSPVTNEDGVLYSGLPTEIPAFGSLSESPGMLASLQSPPDTNAAFLDLYYLRFHRHHPLCLPKAHFNAFLSDLANEEQLRPLFLAIIYIGAMYARSEKAAELKESVRQAITDSWQHPLNPFLVQCRLLYSIALYWSDEKAEAHDEFDAALCLAKQLGMYKQGFAAQNGRGDRVLEESWRRTWWQILVVDACIAGTERRFTIPTCAVVATVDLPCEEHEYETGVIPEPRTLDEFNSRELAVEEHTYSSFAYLVGATHAIALVLTTIPSYLHLDGSSSVIQDIDAIVDGWVMLLPDAKRDVFSREGEMDVLIFQAHMIVHAISILVHRPFSELVVHPSEALSTCATRPSEQFAARELAAVHTTRCLRAVEAQVRLLALPKPSPEHTSFCQAPFVACILATCAMPLLAACRARFAGRRLAVGRAQLRLVIACLRAMARVWPAAARGVRELREIASVVLGVGGGAATGNRTDVSPGAVPAPPVAIPAFDGGRADAAPEFPMALSPVPSSEASWGWANFPLDAPSLWWASC